METPNPKSPGFWAELLRSFQLAWKLFRDDQVPLVAKLVPIASILYILSPIDILPDVFVGLGQLDDLAIVLLGVQVFIALAPKPIVERYRQRMNGGPVDGGWTVTNNPPSSASSTASKEIIDG